MSFDESRAMVWGPIAARTALILAGLCVLGAAAGALGHRFGLIDFRLGLTIYRWSATAALPVGIFALLVMAWILIRRLGLRDFAPALAGFMIATAIFTPGYLLQQQARRLPPIHDISTDTVNPPAILHNQKLRGKAINPVEYGGPLLAKAQQKAYPEIRPRTLPLSPDASFAKALARAKAMGWEITSVKPDEGRIEAIASTTFFGFKDDVVIRVKPAGAGSSRVDIRSVSRVGKSDMGTNAKRIMDYFAGL